MRRFCPGIEAFWRDVASDMAKGPSNAVLRSDPPPNGYRGSPVSTLQSDLAMFRLPLSSCL